MSKPTLFIAAGHGGSDLGNTSAGYIEAHETIKIVDGIREWYRLTAVPAGIGGVIFIENDLALAGEITRIAEFKPDSGDLAIDLHLDYHTGQRGSLVIQDQDQDSVQFGSRFLYAWCKATGMPYRGIYDSKKAAQAWRGWSDFGFCAPKWPGVIVELGCLNSPEDMQLVRNPLYQALAGQLIIETWRGIQL